MFETIKKGYADNKYLLIKDAVRLESFGLDFDFNSMFSLFAKNTALASRFTNKETPFLSEIISIDDIVPDFNTYKNFIITNLKDVFDIGKLNFFYSIKGEVGISHVDREHVIILGIHNITYYHIDNIDLKIEPGDILYVPKGYLHHAFSARERIVLSLSLWEKTT